MEKEEENYSSVCLPANYTGLDHPLDHTHQLMKPEMGENSSLNSIEMVDYMFNKPQPQQISLGFCTSSSLDRSSLSEVMQFTNFGSKLALSQARLNIEEENGIDPIYLRNFLVLNDELQDQTILDPPPTRDEEEEIDGLNFERNIMVLDQEDEEEEEVRVQLGFHGGSFQQNPTSQAKMRRKRLRSVVKTREEVESQRMTHIAVERNRRKQMNEHLGVLRSLMPSSYVQRGDQASIVGGAIEFVRELEQLLQCLESQKRRRLFSGGSEAPRPIGDSPTLAIQQNPQPPSFPPLPLPNDQIKLIDLESGLHEEIAENKSYLADVEVKLLGFDAMIKILSRPTPGQLLKTIAALEDLQLNILHTNITTIEQTVLYSFNVKVANEMRCTAEDIANSVQQIFNFIHASVTV